MKALFTFSVRSVSLMINIKCWDLSSSVHGVQGLFVYTIFLFSVTETVADLRDSINIFI